MKKYKVFPFGYDPQIASMDKSNEELGTTQKEIEQVRELESKAIIVNETDLIHYNGQWYQEIDN